MNTKQLVGIVAIAALVGAAAAVPPWGPRGGPPAFNDIDADSNGVITAEEFDTFHANRMAQRASQGYPMRNAGRGPRFEAMDLDGDNALTEQELDQWRAGRMGNRPCRRWAEPGV